MQLREHQNLREPLMRLCLLVNNELAVTQNLNEALEKLVELGTKMIGAERGTIFLNDLKTGELYSRVAQGEGMREIRFMNHIGVSGWVFRHGKGAIVHEAYQDKRFNKAIDARTGFKTQNILCAPFRTVEGKIIGVAQLLNKHKGKFQKRDLEILEAITKQAAIAVQGHIQMEQFEAAHRQELEFMDVVSKIASELELTKLLSKIIATVTKMLDAERSSLFIHDKKTEELYTVIGEGLGKNIIRFPSHMGIAGHVFTTGESLNIPHCYADLRFNPAFDKQTGFFTRNMLCIPVVNKEGKRIGVSQVLNKKGGTFTEDDEARLKAFTSQIAIGIENAALFDNVQNLMHYNQSMLTSMSNGVITTDEEGKVVTCNPAGFRILKMEAEKEIVGKDIKEVMAANPWLVKKLEKTDNVANFLDVELIFRREKISANITLLPLLSKEKKVLGTLMMIEDISNEKRMKSTMSRYMDPGLADKLLAAGEGEDILGGQQSTATVLFSDIRSFTTLSEKMGAQGTVSFLNDYFSVMVECIQKEGGMLDKFIGDAMMAIFGTPLPHEDDPDRAVRTAIKMMSELTGFNQKRMKQGKEPIGHGMGINTDKIVSGNIGSPKRMDYTVIGDGVNLASRIESACKQYGANILISELTFHALKATYRTRQVDKVVVKGKTKPVNVYEVLDFHNKESFPNMIDVLGFFNEGIELYHEARWDKAIAKFQAAIKGNPKDQCSQIYIDRCEHLKQHPPQGEWDGVWVMTSK